MDEMTTFRLKKENCFRIFTVKETFASEISYSLTSWRNSSFFKESNCSWASILIKGMEVDDSVPSSVSVGTMSYSEVSSWITRLIGSFGRCISLGSRRNVLRKYLQKQEAGASVHPSPLSSSVDDMPFEEVSMLVIDQIGSFADCNDELSQRDLLKAYLHNKELKGQGRLSDDTHLNSDCEVELGSDIVEECSNTVILTEMEN